jgi:hypothetical protein
MQEWQHLNTPRPELGLVPLTFTRVVDKVGAVFQKAVYKAFA